MKGFDRKRLTQTFMRFVVVGSIATAVQYLVLVGSVELLGWSSVLGSGIGFLMGAIVNYLLNRRFTFRSDVPHTTAVARFVVVLSVGLTLNLALMYLFTHRLGLPYLIAQVLTTGLVLFWHFAGNALWSFAHPSSPRTAG